MTEMDKKADAGLDAFFDAARRDTGQLPDPLMRRMLADALREQDRVAPAQPAPSGGWARLLEALGGWPAVGGLVSASAVGLWLGFAPPPSLPDPVQLMVQTQSDLDLFGDDDLALALSEEG